MAIAQIHGVQPPRAELARALEQLEELDRTEQGARPTCPECVTRRRGELVATILDPMGGGRLRCCWCGYECLEASV